MAAHAGLTQHQVTTAIAYLRDHYPDFPLLSSPLGYRFSVNEAEINRFRCARARVANTIIRRLWTGTMKPFLECGGELAETRLITKQFERLLEDIEELTT